MKSFKDLDFTFREFIFGSIIFIIMIGLGFLISNSIHDSVSSNNEKYFKSLKVKDSEMFKYAFETNIGYTLSEGTFSAVEPVSNKNIEGNYFYILEVEEHYVEKTRTESYQCGEETCTRIVTYWEWDEYDRDSFHTNKFAFLEKEFNYSDVSFSNTSYNSTVKINHYKRYVYYTIPKSFDGSLFGYASKEGISNTTFFPNKSISDVVAKKEKEADTYTTIFWVGWVIFALIIVFVFMALDNRYLNGRNY